MKAFTFDTPLGKKGIGPGHPVFIIAEAGSNWSQGSFLKYKEYVKQGGKSMNQMDEKEKDEFIHKWFDRDIFMGKALIDVAVDAGASAVKFQTYRAETVYVENAGTSDYLSETGYIRTINEIFDDLSMPYELVKIFADYATKKGILFMSTCFSKQDVDEVDPYTSIHKIPSYEINHVRLIEHLAKTGKPIIMSSGAATLEEVQDALDICRKNGNDRLAVMQCTAKYPAPISTIKPELVRALALKLNVPTGLSDHSRDPLLAPLLSVAYGAYTYEVHYTLHNKLPGADHGFALTPEELKDAVTYIRMAEEAREGIDFSKETISSEKSIFPSEEELRSFAVRGVQAVKDIKAGEAFTEADFSYKETSDGNISILRPGKQKKGVLPKMIDEIIGKTAKRDIKKGEGVQEGDW